jgi:hypothetical protein
LYSFVFVFFDALKAASFLDSFVGTSKILFHDPHLLASIHTHTFQNDSGIFIYTTHALNDLSTYKVSWGHSNSLYFFLKLWLQRSFETGSDTFLLM